MPNATIHLHRHDLPDGLDLGPVVAVDTETMGLNPHRDRLCLVQLSGGDGHAHLVQLIPEALGEKRGFDSPNLKHMMADTNVVKLMHFARRRRRAAKRSGHYRRAGPLHEDRGEAGAHLHRSPRAQGSVQGASGSRSVQATADFGLGLPRSVARAMRLRRLGRVAFARVVGAAGGTLLVREGRLDLARRASGSCPSGAGSTFSVMRIPIFSTIDSHAAPRESGAREAE